MTTVYLAGGINGLSDSDAKDWREYAKAHLKADTLDPMWRDYRGKEDVAAKEIVLGDMADIEASDAVLAYCPRPSWGTAMEILIASSFGKPVYVVVPGNQDVSPWLRYFATRVFRSTLAVAIPIINKELSA